MSPDPSPELQAKRWENAKKLVQTFKQYCLDNEAGFLLEDDSILILPSQLVITDSEINIINERCTYNLYDNDVDMDHGVHDTTEHWYNNCSLFNCQIIKIFPEESLKNRITVNSDEVSININPTNNLVKDLRYTMPLV